MARAKRSRKAERPLLSGDSAFRDAIAATDRLQLMAGLQAIKDGEGKGQISGNDPRHVLGSVAIDDDCKAAYPNDCRWDYVVGYNRAGQAIAHFIEVHSAETSEVSKVADKLGWLMKYLQEPPQRKLAAFSREYHWVASGRINIPQHTPQFKRLNSSLRKLGLRGPVKSLELI